MFLKWVYICGSRHPNYKSDENFNNHERKHRRSPNL